ncbi:MAG: MFS transporter [Proteobacteria bacterium]|nr:MFS transporter [Pseudomonadota bacterium]MBW3616635.1 MFS transporter [Pseudomonadota bacterium]
MTHASASQPEPTRGYRLYVLLLLVLVYTFNFLDRQILGILAEPIKEDLGLSDRQLGLMGGVAFAVVYSTLAVPIAWLADRRSRTWIIAGALTVWSGFTMLCGAAGGFWQLFLARMGVGVGEAGGVAPSYSLIADYFPARQRARALAAYSFGIPIGTAAGTLFGGLLAAQVDWRFAFLVVGAAGLLLAPLFKLTVRDPRRGGWETPAQPVDDGPANAMAPAIATETVAPAFGRVAGTVLPKISFWLLALGAASSSVCGYGVAFWLPSFFARSYDMTLPERSVFYAAIALIGGVIGIWGGGAVADKFGGRSRSAYPLVPAVAFVIAMPIFFLAVNTDSRTAAFLLWLIPTGLNLAWLGPILTAVQHLGSSAMRSTVSAMFLLINNLLGIAGGLYYFGWASDMMAPRFGEESLRYAIYSGLGFYLVASLLFVAASRTLKRDWVEA